MKTLILLFCITYICGCAGAYKDKNKLIQMAYRDGYKRGVDSVTDGMITIDSGGLYSYPNDSSSQDRYFLVSYRYGDKNGNDEGFGDIWFNCNKYPSKNVIDSMIFTSMKFQKSCYQPMIILSIHEFNDAEDYNDFTLGQKPRTQIKKHKKCQPLMFTIKE